MPWSTGFGISRAAFPEVRILRQVEGASAPASRSRHRARPTCLRLRTRLPWSRPADRRVDRQVGTGTASARASARSRTSTRMTRQHPHVLQREDERRPPGQASQRGEVEVPTVEVVRVGDIPTRRRRAPECGGCGVIQVEKPRDSSRRRTRHLSSPARPHLSMTRTSGSVDCFCRDEELSWPRSRSRSCSFQAVFAAPPLMSTVLTWTIRSGSHHRLALVGAREAEELESLAAVELEEGSKIRSARSALQCPCGRSTMLDLGLVDDLDRSDGGRR